MACVSHQVFVARTSSQDNETLIPQAVSYHHNLGVQATLYNLMNADMVVTTGSSFPLVAIQASPKVNTEPILLGITKPCN